MTDGTHEGEYVNHYQKHGYGHEGVYQTRAICSIADTLTAIASDIRAIRENSTRKDTP